MWANFEKCAPLQQLLSALLRWKRVLLTRPYTHRITPIDFSSFGGTYTMVAGGERQKKGGTIVDRWSTNLILLAGVMRDRAKVTRPGRTFVNESRLTKLCSNSFAG